MYMSAHMYVCAPCVSGAHRSRKRVSDTLALEFQEVVSGHVGARAASVLNCCAVSQVTTTLVFEKGLSLNMELTDWSDWLVSKPLDPPVSVPPVLGLQVHATKLSFYVSAGDLPWDGPAGTLSTEPSPQPSYNSLRRRGTEFHHVALAGLELYVGQASVELRGPLACASACS